MRLIFTRFDGVDFGCDITIQMAYIPSALSSTTDRWRFMRVHFQHILNTVVVLTRFSTCIHKGNCGILKNLNFLAMNEENNPFSPNNNYNLLYLQKNHLFVHTDSMGKCAILLKCILCVIFRIYSN